MSELLFDQKIEDRFLRSAMEYEKLLTLTVNSFSEKNFSSRVKANLWKVICFYWNEFKKVPSKDLIAVTAEELFKNESQSNLVVKLLDRIMELPVPEWSWVVSKVDKQIKSISLQKALYNSAEMLKGGNLQGAEEELVQTIRHSGIIAENSKNDIDLTIDEIKEFATDSEEFCCPTRIYALDKYIKGLYRKELFVIIAPLNVGKSWSVIHLATSALLSGKFVLYLTLEMSKNRVLQRIFQNVSGTYSPSSPEDDFKPIEIWSGDSNWDEVERVERLVPSFHNSEKVSDGLETLKRFGGKLSLKEYPSGTCRIKDIQKQIELFDVSFDKLPDVVIVDGLLDIHFEGNTTTERNRLGLSQITRDLRMLASVYNCSVITTHQANRDAIKEKVVGAEHTGESIGISQISDTAISLNQTKSEYNSGKMRINVVRARNQRKWGMVEILQNLEIGQFCQYSKQMKNDDSKEK